MKLHITPAVLSEMEGAITDARANALGINGDYRDPSDPTYLKIADAITSRGATIEADENDLRELNSRAKYVVEDVVPDNLSWGTDRGYWLGQLRAYRALLKQMNATS